MKKRLLQRKMPFLLALAGVLSLGTHAQVTRNLILDLDFENGITDSSSASQATGLFGATSFGTDKWGNANSALEINGSVATGECRLTDNSGSYKVDFPATLSAWVYINAHSSVNSPIITTEDNGAVYTGMWMDVNANGGVNVAYGNGVNNGTQGRRSWTTADGTIPLGEWHMVTAVYNSTTDVKIYVDGTERSSTISGGATSLVYFKSIGTNGKIGGYVKGTADRSINGKIDKVKIYDAALTPSEILSNYFTTKPNRSSLLLNYDFNGGYGDVSIYEHSTAAVGTLVFESDRKSSAAPAALTTSLSSALELLDVNGNYKAQLPLTFAAWIKPNDSQGYYPIFTNDDSQNSYTGVWIQTVPGGKISVSVGSGYGAGSQGRRSFTSVDTVVSGQWTHVAAVLKPVGGGTIYNLELYFDGVLQGLGAQDGTANQLIYTNLAWSGGKVGAYYNGTASFKAFNGAIDDVMLWNDSLNASQIANIHANYYNDVPNNLTVSVADITEKSIGLQVYPNPSSSVVTISAAAAINSYQLLSSTGRVLAQANLLGTLNAVLDLSSYASGLYFVRVETAAGTYTQKVFKQ